MTINNLTEKEAKQLAEEMEVMKGFNVYFIDFTHHKELWGYGYNALVYKNNHLIYVIDRYTVYSRAKKLYTHQDLKDIYVSIFNNTIFTEEEIIAPLKNYEEYKQKMQYLVSYYILQVNNIDSYMLLPTPEKKKEFDLKTKDMYLDPISLHFVYDKNFIDRHKELYFALDNEYEKLLETKDGLVEAFLAEMEDHEYAINMQRNMDVMSIFADIDRSEYKSEWDWKLDKMFELANFTPLQREAYLEARGLYYQHYQKFIKNTAL